MTEEPRRIVLHLPWSMAELVEEAWYGDDSGKVISAWLLASRDPHQYELRSANELARLRRVAGA